MCFCANIKNKLHVTIREYLKQRVLKTIWKISKTLALLFSLDFKLVTVFKKDIEDAIIWKAMLSHFTTD
jgi:hypothetical protein